MKVSDILIILLLLVGLFNPVKYFSEEKLEIEKPVQVAIDNTEEFSNLFKDDDRLEVAVLANELSKRVTGEKYSNVKFQTLNDIYLEASKMFYSSKMSEKYPSFPEEMKKFLIEAAGTEDDIILSEEDKENVSNYLRGLAWNLR